jgi:hypothetical protein
MEIARSADVPHSARDNSRSHISLQITRRVSKRPDEEGCNRSKNLSRPPAGHWTLPAQRAREFAGAWEPTRVSRRFLRPVKREKLRKFVICDSPGFPACSDPVPFIQQKLFHFNEAQESRKQDLMLGRLGGGASKT